MDNTFFNLLKLLRRSSEMFRWRNDNTELPILRFTYVCVSEARVFTWNFLQPFQPVSSFLGNVSQTKWQHWLVNPESHVFVCVCVCVRPKPGCLHLPEISLFPIHTHSVVTHHYSGAVTLLTESTILISLHVFVFVLTVKQDILLIHDAVFFFLHVVCFA